MEPTVATALRARTRTTKHRASCASPARTRLRPLKMHASTARRVSTPEFRKAPRPARRVTAVLIPRAVRSTVPHVRRAPTVGARRHHAPIATLASSRTMAPHTATAARAAHFRRLVLEIARFAPQAAALRRAWLRVRRATVENSRTRGVARATSVMVERGPT